MAVSRLRSMFKLVKPMRTADGDGVALYRSIGGPKIDNYSPFLLLDEFKSDNADDYIGGFPDHPHRYVLRCSCHAILTRPCSNLTSSAEFVSLRSSGSHELN
jgi:hypothetical protein